LPFRINGGCVWKNGRARCRGFFGGEQPPRPRICPACGALVELAQRAAMSVAQTYVFLWSRLSKKLSGVFGENETPVTQPSCRKISMLGVSG